MTGTTQIVLYEVEGKNVPVEVRYMNETFWLTQKEIAELFECSSDNVSLHLKNIFSAGELSEGATTEEISVVRTEGARQVRRIYHG